METRLDIWRHDIWSFHGDMFKDIEIIIEACLKL